MKRFLLLTAIVCGLILSSGDSFAKGDKDGGELMRLSQLSDPGNYNNTGFPMNFSEIGNSRGNAAVSTGYYFVDSDQLEAPDFWRPVPTIVDTTVEPTLWRRILPGPRIVEPEFWDRNPNEGLRFFRNPALPTGGRSFFDHGDLYATDSTDDAFAGPIPIGFGFYFNGIRYDSFYVSTNGLVSLTNRRYFYDSEGNRTVPAGSESCYDPMSMDWFRRGRSGDGVGDGTADNFGYYYSVCGGNPGSQLAGIRSRGGAIHNFQSTNNRPAVIAPFFGDLHLSQYWKTANVPDDWGKVYFKRSISADKLIIYFVNIAPCDNGNWASPLGGSYRPPADIRRIENNYVSANAQVVLNRLDSSVTIVYERFDGSATVGGRNVQANALFRRNTTVGVSGFARHVNYDTKDPDDAQYPWASEYQQYTHYYASHPATQASFPHDYMAIRFKQWKNTLRVVDIQYRVRKQDLDANLDFSETVKSSEVANYELLAGEERIGAIQPVCLIQNLTNDIQGPQGVNFQPQELNFRARFRIRNEATNELIYNRVVRIDSTCLALPNEEATECEDFANPDTKVRYSTVTKSGANYTATNRALPTPLNGIPPYGFVQVYFPPFEPNEFVTNHIGRLRAYIIADPTSSQAGALGDQWPFDDTTSVPMFVMNRLEDFNDDVTEYHLIGGTPMPSVLKWVNIEGEVADGDEVSHHPLPPRGEYAADNEPTFELKSPVIRLNRLTLAGMEPPTSPGGDELRSFPIDIRRKDGREDPVLSMSFQRTVRADDWPRGWSDNQLVGPEPRSVFNGNLGTVFSGCGNSAANKPDEIVVEFAQPSPDGIQHITNIETKRWRVHPRRGGAKDETKVAAYTLYGAGGYHRGFLESDKDSSLDATTGLRPDIFDEGVDFEFRKAYIPIPNSWIDAENEGAKNFRFRVRVNSTNDKKCMLCIPDDDDPFFVDNVKILFRKEVTDIECSSVKLLWPYSIAPASQATAIPIKVKVSNNTTVNAPTFRIKTKIWKEGFPDPIYCRVEVLPFLVPGLEVEKTMPVWNARRSGPGKYTLESMVILDDLEEKNDTTYTEVNLKFGPVFTYEKPADNPQNDVPSFTGLNGRGLNLYGSQWGGTGGQNSCYPAPSPYDEISMGSGATGGSGSGQIGMMFELVQSDTVYGYQVYYGEMNQEDNLIQLSIYTDMNQPGQQLTPTRIFDVRGWDHIRSPETGEYYWDEYVTYLLPEPVVLPSGRYWAVVGQQGETGIELGASASRVGMRQTSLSVSPTGICGTSGVHLCIEKTFREENGTNKNFFAFENTAGSQEWVQFMATYDNPGYAHLHHFGVSPVDGTTWTLSRGTWIPLVRPFLRDRSSGQPTAQICPDDIPVELTSFEGYVRDEGILLFWETSSEIDNKGFHVERRILDDKGETPWKSVTFVEGAGNSTYANEYRYLDKEVEPNTTYQYRLRQVDLDGTQSCPTEEFVEKTFTHFGLVLKQNRPNPFSDVTEIEFAIPMRDYVKLEVLDIYGNVVKTLIDQELGATRHDITWDGITEDGARAVSGAYLYRLTVGDKVQTGKMTLIRN